MTIEITAQTITNSSSEKPVCADLRSFGLEFDIVVMFRRWAQGTNGPSGALPLRKCCFYSVFTLDLDKRLGVQLRMREFLARRQANPAVVPGPICVIRKSGGWARSICRAVAFN